MLSWRVCDAFRNSDIAENDSRGTGLFGRMITLITPGGAILVKVPNLSGTTTGCVMPH